MFKEITEQEIADMFNISLEKLKKEIADGTIKCFANDDKIFIVPNPSDKPLKIVYDDNWVMNLDGYSARFSRELTDLEFKRLLIEVFGTSDIGTINKDDFTEDEWVIIEEILKQNSQ